MLTNLVVLSTMKNACGYGRRFNFHEEQLHDQTEF